MTVASPEPMLSKPPALAAMIVDLDTACARLGKFVDQLDGVLSELECRLEPLRLRPEHHPSVHVDQDDDRARADAARCSVVTSHIRDRVWELADLQTVVVDLERRVVDLTAELEV